MQKISCWFQNLLEFWLHFGFKHSWLVHFLCHNRELSNTRGAIMLHLFYVDNKLADQNPKTTDKHMIRCSLSSRS